MADRAERPRPDPGPTAPGGPASRRARGTAAAATWPFVAAALFALLAIPPWLALYAGALGLPPGAEPPASWHGHEMLFGYALAVVAGFLLVRPGRAVLAALAAAWLAGRAALPVAGAGAGVAGTAAAAALALAFPSLLAALTAPGFLRAAKRWANRPTGPLLVAFPVAEALYWAGALGLAPGGRAAGLLLALDLVTLLLLVMGGRVIPAATSGALHRRGEPPTGGVRPGLERAALAAMVAALVFDQIPGLHAAAGVAAAAAGVAGAMRLARWHGWRVRDRPDLWGLHLGYAWLAAGLMLKGGAQALGWPPPSAAHHALAVGALGTLSLVMMARIASARAGRGDAWAARRATGWAAAALSAAALARLAAASGAPPAGGHLGWLWLSAAFWEAAFIWLLVFLLRAQPAARPSSRRRGAPAAGVGNGG